MELTAAKILTMVLLGGVAIILGFIPLYLGKWFRLDKEGNPRHGTMFSSLLCFGGGVLLATSFLHLLPEVSIRRNYDRFNAIQPASNFHSYT